MNYRDFASNISFFEFIQEEFYDPAFDVEKYKNELHEAQNVGSIEDLSSKLKELPKIIDVFENIFQLSRFDNTQYIHFCFDINILNNAGEENLINYIKKSVIYFENGVENYTFKNIYNKYLVGNLNQDIIAACKRAIPEYISKCVYAKENMYNHLKNSISSRLRIAKYLIETLKADEFSQAVDMSLYLKIKRIPKDSKGIHGKFGTIKISKILEDEGIKDISREVDKIINIKSKSGKLSQRYTFAKEKSISGIRIKKNNSPKVFDFVIFNNGIPSVAIETNFYSTSGTKIGINEGEYTDLNEDINLFNKNNKCNIKFIWITDGNYWLSKDGEKRFNNLNDNYFKNDYQILNYNLFKKYLSSILS